MRVGSRVVTRSVPPFVETLADDVDARLRRERAEAAARLHEGRVHLGTEVRVGLVVGVVGEQLEEGVARLLLLVEDGVRDGEDAIGTHELIVREPVLLHDALGDRVGLLVVELGVELLGGLDVGGRRLQGRASRGLGPLRGRRRADERAGKDQRDERQAAIGARIRLS